MFSNFPAVLLVSFLHIALRGNVIAYSQISTYGTASNGEGPKIFKALNPDLIFPKTFNSSVNIISTTSMPQASPTISATPPPQSHNEMDAGEVGNAAKAAAPVVFVTPPTTMVQTSFTPHISNEQMIESNQMLHARTEEHRQPAQKGQFEPNGNDERNESPQQFTSTGRAVDYRPHYRFDQFMDAAKPNMPPLQRPYALRQSATAQGYASPYNGRNVIYPAAVAYQRQYQRPKHLQRRPLNYAEIVKSGGRAQISDRFTPGEAVASALFKQQYNHKPSSGKISAPSNVVQSYVAPKDLYSFPPNINSRYPKPSEDPKAALPSSSVNSYVPPPAGPLTNSAGYPLVTAASSNQGYVYKEPTSSSDGYVYNGPVHPEYLPPNDMKDSNMKPSDMPPNDGANDDDSIGVLPASAMDANNDDHAPENGNGDTKAMDDPMPTIESGTDHDDHNHDHDHGHDHPLEGHDTDQVYPTPPPGWMEEHPGSSHHGPSFPDFSHHYPEIIYDHHDFHHDFHFDHHHDLPTTTLPPPPPEPLPSEEPEGRVKKYSYFYIGRKLWYIPLYFTVWFSFYVLWLILKSIARHKVNLPNHYVNRRSLPDNMDAKAKEYINNLTVSVLKQIEGFQRKYNTD